MDNKIFIGGFNDPNVTRENYRLLAASGINGVFIIRKKPLDKVLEALSYGDEFGLSILVDVADSPDFFDNDVFKKYKSFAGFHIMDEPGGKDFEKIAFMIEPFEKRFGLDKIFFVNLQTDQWNSSNRKVQASDFSAHVEQFCEQVLSKISGPKILSVDSYPLMMNFHNLPNSLDNRHLEVLEIISYFAKKYDAETHLYIQTMGYGNEHRVPDIDDIRFQFYVGLSYGFKAFTHFCYYTPGGTCQDFVSGNYAMVYKDDSLSDLYYIVKEANAELQLVSKVVKKLDYKGTMFVDGNISFNEYIGKNYLQHEKKEITGIENIESDYECIIGEFDYQGKTTYILTNFTNPIFQKSTNVKIIFSDNAKYEIRYRDKTDVIELNDKTLSLNLRQGEGIIIIKK